MAMTDEVSDDLDLLRRVFPKWQCENILSYLMKTPTANRVKHAICRYIHSHDLNLNRDDCEADAKLVHEVFPEVPFADIFRKITLFGDERNRVRICLRLLLFENGFKISASSDFDIDSDDIQDMVKDSSKVMDDLNATLVSLNDIRNKYEKTSEPNEIKLNSASLDSDSDVFPQCNNRVVLSESPEVDIDDPQPSTSKELKNHSSDSPESSEIIDTIPNHKKARKFSIELEQLEEFFNNSDVIDFTQNLKPVEVEKINKIQVDKIDVADSSTIVSELLNLKTPNENLQNNSSVVCINPFDDNANKTRKDNNKKELIDLTRNYKGRKTKPCTITSSEIINLDTQDVNLEVIIEEKQIPEPILIKKKKPRRFESPPKLVKSKETQLKQIFKLNLKSAETEQINNNKIDEDKPISGTSGVQQKRKSKIPVIKEENLIAKKSKMEDSVIEIFSDTHDNTMSFEEFFDETINSSNTNQNNNNNRNSLMMYDDLLDKKKRASLYMFGSSQESSEEISQESEASNEASANEKSEEENLIVDEGLYFPLLEIFPEACPAFLKKLCSGKENKGSEIDLLISKVLDMDDYPKRVKFPEEDVPVEISEEDQLEILIQVLPDADPMYLKKQIEECSGNSEAIKQFINDAMENKDYPTLKEHQRKQAISTQTRQYTTDFHIEKYLEQIPDPEDYFKDKKFKDLTYEERDYIVGTLKNVFNMLPIRLINTKINASKSITVIFDSLNDLAAKSSNHMKCRRKVSEYNTVLQNIPFLQEIAFNVHRAEIVNYRATRAKLLNKRREEHRAAGTLQTCVCCYDDTLLPEEVIQCEVGCDSCKICVQRSTEVAFGEGKTDFPCVGGCGNEYTMRLLQDALSKKLFSKVAQKRQLAEVRAAGLEDLEQCPFCDFANIPSAEDRLFRCFNPECMKESCRKCNEPNHIPLRCEEVEKDADVAARTKIENRMTEALLRTCWKCDTKFIKSDGCNKMTCPKCGAFSCYICGKAVKDYTHFNGQGGDRFDLCPLYSDTNKLHEEAVIKAAKEAKKDIDPNALKNDPTAKLQEHFDEYKKQNPIVLPPGVQLIGDARPVIDNVAQFIGLRPPLLQHPQRVHHHQHRVQHQIQRADHHIHRAEQQMQRAEQQMQRAEQQALRVEQQLQQQVHHAHQRAQEPHRHNQANNYQQQQRNYRGQQHMAFNAQLNGPPIWQNDRRRQQQQLIPPNQQDFYGRNRAPGPDQGHAAERGPGPANLPIIDIIDLSDINGRRAPGYRKHN